MEWKSLLSAGRAARHLLLPLGLMLAVGLSCSTRTPPPQMHLLLITLDTTRADRLGFDGYDKPTSPRLDALAGESVVFTNAIAQAAVTPVSHASILTGQNPYRHGLRVLHGLAANRLEEEAITLAEVWERAGGQTAAFVSAFPVAPSFGLDQGFGLFDSDFRQAGGEGLVSPEGVVSTGLSQRRADRTTQATAQWLRAQDLSAKPLFLWVHYFDPHDAALAPPREWIGEELAGTFKPTSPGPADHLRAVYDCEVLFMDSQIGLLLDEVRRLGLWDNTLVVVVADHGEGLGDHNWWSHGILYQEQIRVPMLIRLPGDREGRRVDHLVRTIDLMPTILEITGIDPGIHPTMDGTSLLGTIRTGESPAPRVAYSESVNILTYGRPDTRAARDHKNDKLYCLMTERFKLIYHQLQTGQTEFYDLEQDPFEQVNLAAACPVPMDSLMRSLEALGAFSEIMPGTTPTDYERMRKLRSLGYVQ